MCVEEYSTIFHLWFHHVSLPVSSALITITASVIQICVSSQTSPLYNTSVIFQWPKHFEHLLPFSLELFFLLPILFSYSRNSKAMLPMSPCLLGYRDGIGSHHVDPSFLMILEGAWEYCKVLQFCWTRDGPGITKLLMFISWMDAY